MGPTSESRSLAVHSLSRRQLVGGFPIPLPRGSASLRLRVAPPRSVPFSSAVPLFCTAIHQTPQESFLLITTLYCIVLSLLYLYCICTVFTVGVLSPHHYFVLDSLGIMAPRTLLTIFLLYLYYICTLIHHFYCICTMFVLLVHHRSPFSFIT